jgi:hypothetical protein
MTSVYDLDRLGSRSSTTTLVDLLATARIDDPNTIGSIHKQIVRRVSHVRAASFRVASST